MNMYSFNKQGFTNLNKPPKGATLKLYLFFRSHQKKCKEQVGFQCGAFLWFFQIGKTLLVKTLLVHFSCNFFRFFLWRGKTAFLHSWCIAREEQVQFYCGAPLETAAATGTRLQEGPVGVLASLLRNWLGAVGSPGVASSLEQLRVAQSSLEQPTVAKQSVRRVRPVSPVAWSSPGQPGVAWDSRTSKSPLGRMPFFPFLLVPGCRFSFSFSIIFLFLCLGRMLFFPQHISSRKKKT